MAGLSGNWNGRVRWELGMARLGGAENGRVRWGLGMAGWVGLGMEGVGGGWEWNSYCRFRNFRVIFISRIFSFSNYWLILVSEYVIE